MSTQKELVWSMRGRLFTLCSRDLFELAKSVAAGTGDTVKLSEEDNEGCMDDITSYLQSDTLLQLEDEGMSQLLTLDDLMNEVTQTSDTRVRLADRDTTPDMPSPQKSKMLLDPQPTNNRLSDVQTEPQTNTETELREELRKVYEMLEDRIRLSGPVASLPERPVTPRDLSYLPRREFKVFGGQIGDNNSEINYNCLTKQINEGIKEGFADAEIIRGVLKIVKPGTFRDMLMLQDELSIHELQGFLRSHLGEKATTEMFQELMCARQAEQESPQQFLYRMIGLKQKLIFQSKQTNTETSSDPITIQGAFLHTIYQGLGVKYTDLRQRLRPLISKSNVTDEEILCEVTKIISDETEHRRRLGQTTRHRPTQAQSAVMETEDKVTKEQSTSQTIKQLAAQVDALTNMVATLMETKTVNHYEPSPIYHQPPANQLPTCQRKTFRCPKCTEQDLPECSHCFVCGEPGHRAVGCLKRTGNQGNGNRPLSRDSQRPALNRRPTSKTSP